MLKKFLLASLSLWLGAAQAGYTDPLILTEIPGNRLIEPGAHSIVTYHVTSNVTNQVVPFTIVPNRYFSVRHQGFTCGSINNPSIAAGGSCQFQLEMHQAPFTPGTFTATQRIKTQGADRGGSNGALIRKTITYTIDTPNALSFSPEPIQDTEVEDNGDGDREIFLFYTIHNGGTGTISNIEWDITPADGTATNSTFAAVANTCSDEALPTADAVEGTLNFNLAAGASCSIVYRFSADSTAGTATLDLQATADGGFDTGAKQTLCFGSFPHNRGRPAALPGAVNGIVDILVCAFPGNDITVGGSPSKI